MRFDPVRKCCRQIETGAAVAAAIGAELKDPHHKIRKAATLGHGDIGRLATGTNAYIVHILTVTDGKATC